MSSLLKTIADWKESNKEGSYRDLFKDLLHKAPYFLRYALDPSKPDLFMIYQTDYSDRTDAVVRECNGIILNMDYSIVAYGMDRMVDKTEDFKTGRFTLEEYKNPEDGTSKPIIIEEAEDGAVLTVYHYQPSDGNADGAKWVVSTKRSIDAHNVRWSSHKDFYQLLCDAVPDNDPQTLFDKNLHKDYTYSFILLHPENQLVVAHAEPKLIYVSKRNKKTLSETNASDNDAESFTWANKRTQISYDEACDKLTGKGSPTTKRGVIVGTKVTVDSVTNISRLMVDYKWFNEANNLRKGMPSLHLSYLSCSPDEKQRMRGYFGNLEMFNVIDHLLRDLIHYTHNVYKDSYIRKQFKVSIEHPISRTIRKLHYTYKTTGNPVTIHDVVDVVGRIPVTALDNMLQFFAAYGFGVPVDPNDLPAANAGHSGVRNKKSPRRQSRIDDEQVSANPIPKMEGCKISEASTSPVATSSPAADAPTAETDEK